VYDLKEGTNIHADQTPSIDLRIDVVVELWFPFLSTPAGDHDYHRHYLSARHTATE